MTQIPNKSVEICQILINHWIIRLKMLHQNMDNCSPNSFQKVGSWRAFEIRGKDSFDAERTQTHPFWMLWMVHRSSKIVTPGLLPSGKLT